jgi:hypothetical protein
LLESSGNAKGNNKAGNQTTKQEFDKGLIETREEMREKLKYGTKFNRDEIVGVMVAGTVENPEIATRTTTFPEDDIQRILAEVSEIKLLLFCRLLLGHAALLPAALRADSIEAFLDDPEVTEPCLGDLCLKMERPGLQEIRDACADLFRSETEEEEEEEEEMSDEEGDGEDDEGEFDPRFLVPREPKGALPKKWKSKREKARERMEGMPTREQILEVGGEEGAVVDFGEIKDGKFHKKMVRVKICGRTIWNYPSNKAMNRQGWLHFCIIAKDSSLHAAIALCRNWDEFFQLNILAIWDYFPGVNWANWVGNRWRQQMLQLGFIMYSESSEPDAYKMTRRHQAGSRRGQLRRHHAVLEARNFICGHIKRDDPVSRRLIQYLAMQSHLIVLLVRDAESGRLLVKPDEDQRWLPREKSGLGRASRGQ